ncbi:hypothetical protein BKA70DRAFT_1443205 [Coprinopsis sp. MPI-PUGE-AT-0042]|nr:hypothetical protein BKA70DRAFT_1443205 [Coprinopsis sp. MPI-PUGE-AT-0042]
MNMTKRKEEEGAKGDGGEWDSEGEEDLKVRKSWAPEECSIGLCVWGSNHHQQVLRYRRGHSDEENDEPRDEPEPGADVEAMDEEEAEPVEGNADMIVPDDGEEVLVRVDRERWRRSGYRLV